MDLAQLDPNGDGGGRVVGSNSRRVDDTWVRPTPSQSGSRLAIPKLRARRPCSIVRVDPQLKMTPKNGTWDNLAQESRDLLEAHA